MKKIGKLLVMLGAVVALIAFNLDVTGGDGRIVNMNMMAQRQNLLIIGCVVFLAGVVLLVGAQSQSGTVREMPTGLQQATDSASHPQNKVNLGAMIQEDVGNFLRSLRRDMSVAGFIAQMICGLIAAIVGANLIDAFFGPVNTAMYGNPPIFDARQK